MCNIKINQTKHKATHIHTHTYQKKLFMSGFYIKVVKFFWKQDVTEEKTFLNMYMAKENFFKLKLIKN